MRYKNMDDNLTWKVIMAKPKQMIGIIKEQSEDSSYDELLQILGCHLCNFLKIIVF